MRLAWAIFPISLTLIYAGMQRNGNTAILLVTASVVLAYYLKDHWVRAWFLWQIVLAVLMYSILIAFPCQYTMRLHMNAMDFMVKLSAGIIIFIAATEICISKHRYIFNVFCIFVLFECLVFMFQQYNLDIEQISATVIGATMRDIPRAGTLGNKNFFAAILAITMPMFFRKKWCWFLPIIILVLFLQQTTGGIVAATVAIAYFLLKSKQFRIETKALIFASLAFGFVVFVQFFDTIALDDFRRYTWWDILRSMPQWIYLGNGPGSYPIWGGAEHVHNDYFEAFFEGGIVSMVIITGYLISILYNAYHQKSQVGIILSACVLALCANALVNYPLHLAPSGFIAAFLLGMAYRWRTTLRMLT